MRVNELIGCKSRTLSTLHTLLEALRDVRTDVVVGYLALLHYGSPHVHDDGRALSYYRHLGVAKA